jgi:hypothetical protein
MPESTTVSQATITFQSTGTHERATAGQSTMKETVMTSATVIMRESTTTSQIIEAKNTLLATLLGSYVLLFLPRILAKFIYVFS